MCQDQERGRNSVLISESRLIAMEVATVVSVPRREWSGVAQDGW